MERLSDKETPMKLKAFRFPKEVSDEMVRAILDGRKSVTRRVVKPQPKEVYHGGTIWDDKGCRVILVEMQDGRYGEIAVPYHPGDILYVRETWQYAYDLDGNEQIIEGTGKYIYAADDPSEYNYWLMPDGTHRDEVPWHPSTRMPKEAARLFLRVTEVRVERLQDIKLLEILREGVHVLQKVKEIGYEISEDDIGRFEYQRLWNSTIKKADLPRYGWAANPWVWVIEFERISKEEALNNA